METSQPLEFEILREIQTRDTKIVLRSDGILCSSSLDVENKRHDGEDAQAVLEAIVTISEGKLYPMLNQLSDLYVTSEAQNIYKQQSPIVLASALIVKSFIQRMIGNFLMGVSRPQVPIKLFENEQDALEWLRTFQKP